MAASKQRLDRYLSENGLLESREKAKAHIIAGQVRVDGIVVSSPSSMVSPDQEIVVDGGDRYVSRGGRKLEKAIEVFGLDLHACVCADIGASTGGFTDCMLQHGAQRVYAVDVGYGQLAWKLRNDPRVKVLERTNARHLESLGEPIDFVSIDVSFISLLLILPAVERILSTDGQVVALIKPQFEAGKQHVGKKGVVRDHKIHEDVLRRITEGADELGLGAQSISFSPIKGPSGNIEYLVHLRRMPATITEDDIMRTVKEAHAELDRASARQEP